MEIGVISDIHSNSIALEKVLSQSDIQRTSEIYCAGDLVGYYSRPNQVVDIVRGKSIHCVKGNHDEAVSSSTPTNFSIDAKRSADWNRRNLRKDNIKYLSNLPEKVRIFTRDRDLVMVHGSPPSPLSEYLYESDIDELFLEFCFDRIPDLVLLGHTHKPFITTVKETLVINPGSVGQPRDGDRRASYAIVDLDSMTAEIRRVEYDIEEIAEETSEELPRTLSDRLFEGR